MDFHYVAVYPMSCFAHVLIQHLRVNRYVLTGVAVVAPE